MLGISWKPIVGSCCRKARGPISFISTTNGPISHALRTMKSIKGFENDLDGFLPFWPSYQGIGKASHEICSIIEVEDFLGGIDTTGENPLSCRPDFDENPIVVIGTM